MPDGGPLLSAASSSAPFAGAGAGTTEVLQNAPRRAGRGRFLELDPGRGADHDLAQRTGRVPVVHRRDRGPPAELQECPSSLPQGAQRLLDLDPDRRVYHRTVGMAR